MRGHTQHPSPPQKKSAKKINKETPLPNYIRKGKVWYDTITALTLWLSGVTNLKLLAKKLVPRFWKFIPTTLTRDVINISYQKKKNPQKKEKFQKLKNELLTDVRNFTKSFTVKLCMSFSCNQAHWFTFLRPFKHNNHN